MKFQNKLDTIEKHVRNEYEKKIVNDEGKCIIRCKHSKEFQHVKFEDENKKYLIRENFRPMEEPSHLYFERQCKEICYTSWHN